MRPYTYSTARSHTPPLIYCRSKSVLPPLSSSIHDGAGCREVGSSALYPMSLQVPSTNPPSNSTYLDSSSFSYGAINHVSNPFSSSANSHSSIRENTCSIPSIVRPSDAMQSSASSLTTSQGSAACTTTTCLQNFTNDEESSRFLSLDTEDGALRAEEAVLKAKITELRTEHQMLDDEQLHLGKCWANLFEREQRYYTEVVPDFSQNTIKGEQHCLALQDQVNLANAHLERVRSELSKLDYVLDDRDKLSKEIESLTGNFVDFGRRRHNCLALAGQFFDVESRRVTEAKRAVLDADDQFVHRKEESFSAGHETRISSTSKTTKNGMVTKSMELERDQNAKESWRDDGAVSYIEDEEQHDMTSSTMDLSSSIPHSGSVENQPPFRSPLLCQGSICVAFSDDEDTRSSNFSHELGGVSTVVSLNNQSEDIFPSKKRKKVDFLGA